MECAGIWTVEQEFFNKFDRDGWDVFRNSVSVELELGFEMLNSEITVKN